MNYLKNCQIEEVKRECIIGRGEDTDNECCLICYEYILEPVSCAKCRGYFCRRCAENWKKMGKKCPKRCSDEEWKLVQLELIDTVLKCPFEPCPGTFVWNLWSDHLKRCYYMPKDVRDRIRLIETRKCEKQHQLSDSNNKSKCSDCQLFTICLSSCIQCKQAFCTSCRHPNLFKTICPNMHRYKLVKTSFTCILCHNFKFNKACYEDKECELAICNECYPKLPSYPDEDQILRSLRWKRKYSA